VDWRDARVVFQDVDGCLNTPQGPLPDGPGQSLNSEQARLLAEIGRSIDASRLTEVILNTGRGLSAMDFVVEGLASPKIRYLLAEHGAVGFDIVKQQSIDLSEIAQRVGPADRAARYTQLGPIRDAIAWYHESGEAQISALFGCALPALPKFANLTLMIPTGISPTEVIAAIERSLAANDEIDSSDFVYHFSDLYVDVISDVSKGDGAVLLLHELDIAPEHALPMGDGMNDVSMFEVLGAGFCPANSAQGLKRVCESRSGVVSSLRCGEAALEFYRALAS
jgi:hydroxymethylpyrimidine pyrophosphatase-like HAD family hydrolase